MPPESIAEKHLVDACRRSGVIADVIEHHGETTLLNYVEKLEAETPSPLQSKADLLDIVGRQVRSILGETASCAVVGDLERTPLVLTANHHGVDFFAQSVQGSLIFSLPRFKEARQMNTIPVFAFGSVALNNLTYPRGLLLYNINGSGLNNMPVRFPIFPDRQKRTMVSVAPAMDACMVQRAQTRVAALVREKKISATLNDPVCSLLKDVYASQEVLDLPSYSHQSTLLNHALWRWLFRSGTHHPDMVYLEMEKLVAELLVNDLNDEESLAHMVMFEPSIRQQVLDRLEGNRACWDSSVLRQNTAAGTHSKSTRPQINGGGTHFFWGIDSRQRRIPMLLCRKDDRKDVLAGVDDTGRYQEVPFTEQALVDALRRKAVLPSLFTCFVSVAFARGMVCAGGYFQAEYLPAMKEALVSALAGRKGFGDVAEKLSAIPANRYLSGMQAVMQQVTGNRLAPAGPVEIIAAGGLTNPEIERIMEISVKDAHLASLFETVPDLLPHETRTSDWKDRLALDCYHLLQDRVVVKHRPSC